VNNISQLRVRLNAIQGYLKENGYDGLFISIPENVNYVLTGSPYSALLSGSFSNELALRSGIDNIPGYILITKHETNFATYWYKFDQAHLEVMNRPNISISSIGMTIDENNDAKGRQQIPLVDIISISLDVRWILELLNKFDITILGWDGSFTLESSWMPKAMLNELSRIKEVGKITIFSELNLNKLSF
tara:strand:- start:24420 stop:24986 length:567 start_codon:yes stop_codon:yes gene_type:complete